MPESWSRDVIGFRVTVSPTVNRLSESDEDETSPIALALTDDTLLEPSCTSGSTIHTVILIASS